MVNFCQQVLKLGSYTWVFAVVLAGQCEDTFSDGTVTTLPGTYFKDSKDQENIPWIAVTKTGILYYMTLLPTDEREKGQTSVHSIQNNSVIILSAGQPLELNLSSLGINNRKENFRKTE